MKSMHYIGFDIHKKVINFCEKQEDGTGVDRQGSPAAFRCGPSEVACWANYFESINNL